MSVMPVKNLVVYDAVHDLTLQAVFNNGRINDETSKEDSLLTRITSLSGYIPD